MNVSAGIDCVWCELVAERDRLRAEADKWHQQWVNAHNRMDRVRAALEAAASGLADASEALDIAGLQVDASDAHQAHRAAREALEGPADA